MAHEIAFLNPGEFNTHRARMASVFNAQRRLPELVFSTSITRYYAFEFDLLMSELFWSALRDIAFHYHDSSIIVAVLDPDPIGYYWTEFGYCNAFKIPALSDANAYFNLLNEAPTSSPADAILYNSNIITWSSDNYCWGVWGERDTGIGILGTLDELDLLPSLVTYSIPIAVASRLALQNLQLSEVASARFERQLLANYQDNTR